MRPKKRGWLSGVIGVRVFVTAAVWMVQGVRRAAVSCYAVEGAYPESYEYLKEHYGAMVDEENYAVFYEVFASNIMPDITVIQIGGQP